VRRRGPAAGISGRAADLDRFFENKLEFDRGFFRAPELPGLGLVARESELLKL
jgi:hypothetical protein